MNLSVGIVGLPNVGKSTLFNALLKKSSFARASEGQTGHAKIANYPFTTIEPNVGVVEVPDFRLNRLAQIIADEHGSIPPIIPAVVRFVDIAGLVKGAAQGEGLGNQFLSHIREVDIIVFVLRGFKNENIIRSGSVDPKEDLEVLKTELLLKDLETINKRLETLSKELKSVAPQDLRHQTLRVLAKSKGLIEQGKWLEENLDSEESSKIADLQLLSMKKTIVVLNSDELKLSDKESPLDPKETPLSISAKLEDELADLSEEEQREYLKELGVEESGLSLLIKKAYKTLGLITFFTAGPKEVHAWTVKKGTLAPRAAGVIHTDFERGFIAADVIQFEKLVETGSRPDGRGSPGAAWQKAKAGGFIKTIGKAETIEDGMVVEFKFSV